MSPSRRWIAPISPEGQNQHSPVNMKYVVIAGLSGISTDQGTLASYRANIELESRISDNVRLRRSIDRMIVVNFVQYYRFSPELSAVILRNKKYKKQDPREGRYNA